jgi:hypothetical protein
VCGALPAGACRPLGDETASCRVGDGAFVVRGGSDLTVAVADGRSLGTLPASAAQGAATLFVDIGSDAGGNRLLMLSSMAATGAELAPSDGPVRRLSRGECDALDVSVFFGTAAPGERATVHVSGADGVIATSGREVPLTVGLHGLRTP